MVDRSMKFLLPFLILLSVAAASAQTTGGVKGKIRDEKGNPIAEAKIIVRQADKEIKSATSGAKGEFLIEGLQPGVYNLTVSKTGFTTGSLFNMQVERKKVRDLGGRLILSVDQGTLVIVKGSVFDSNGFSSAGAKVVIEQVMEDGSAKRIDSTYSSETGEFTFKFPEAPAKFRVTASVDKRKASKELSVDSAAIYRISLSLPADPE
jgi:hypothetical protein